MEGADLDYNSHEEKEEGQGYPTLFLWLGRLLILVAVVIVGFILMNAIDGLVFNIRKANYKPTEEVLNNPRKPNTTYEMNGTMEVNIIGKKGEGNLKLLLPKVVLAYNKNNLALSQALITKGPSLGRVVRESIASQRIIDLTDTKMRESVVKNSILKNINNYLMGVEIPDEVGKLSKSLKKGDSVRVVEISKKNREREVSQDYFKVVNIKDNSEGWVPATTVNVDEKPMLITKDVIPLGSKKFGGVDDVKSGIVDVYFPKGLVALNIREVN